MSNSAPASGPGKVTLNPTPTEISASVPKKITLNPTPAQILQIENSRSPTRLTLGPTPTQLLRDIFPTPSTFVYFTRNSRNPTPSNFQDKTGDDDASSVELDDDVDSIELDDDAGSVGAYDDDDQPPSFAPTSVATTFAPTPEATTSYPSYDPTFFPTYPITPEPSSLPTLYPTRPTHAPTYSPTFNRVFSNADIGILLTTVIVAVICCGSLCVYGFCFHEPKKKGEFMPLLPELPSLPNLDFKPPAMDLEPPNCTPSVSGCLQRLRGKKGAPKGRDFDEEEDEVEDDGGGFIVMPSGVPGADTQKLNEILAGGKTIVLYTSKGPRKVKLSILDNEELRWELANASSGGSKKYKLELRDVLHIQIGKRTKNLKDVSVASNLTLSLIFQSLTLDIVADSHDQRDSIVHGFNEIIDGLRKKPI